jgi:hypothetical protein
MFWPVNHMVSTKDKALQCTDCHDRNNSRLAALKDFYMPARDYSPFVENTGIGIIIITFFGVIIHGSIRITSITKRAGKKNGK